MNRKTKKIIIILAVIVIIILGVIEQINFWNTDPESLCNKGGYGWAPVGPIDGAPFGCDGKRLSADSPLIDDEGYTCYCHAPNKCWNGKECVEIAK